MLQCILKVGDMMDKKNLARQIILTSNGIAKTANFLAAGFSKTDIGKLHKDGYIERVHHGYYQLADYDVSEEQLLATLIPEGIVCVESALFYYGYSDFTPRIWTIAVPRTIAHSKLKIEAIHCKAYYVPAEYHEIGKTVGTFNGVQLPVYDMERTICDCFKYRTKLDNETFNKAVHAYIADEKKNLSNLSKYAKELGIYKKVTELMEVLLNG